jgi:hypothetical protein
MRVINTGLFAAAVVAFHSSTAFAQLEVGGTLLDNCAQIDALRKGGDYSAARDKALQCVEGLDQAIQGDIGKSFPTSIAGWTRSNIEQNAALGFNNISATYKKAETTATVAITGGQSGNALGGLLGGIAKLGVQTGQQVRIGGLPGYIQPDGTISVTLENGSFLTFSSPSFSDQESALKGLGDLVNAFPVADINKKLK